MLSYGTYPISASCTIAQSNHKEVDYGTPRCGTVCYGESNTLHKSQPPAQLKIFHYDLNAISSRRARPSSGVN